MKTKLLPILFAAAAAALTASPVLAQTFTPGQLTPRAVEAVIRGMPAVNYERMPETAAKHGAKLNQVVYWSRPVNEKTRVPLLRSEEGTLREKVAVAGRRGREVN